MAVPPVRWGPEVDGSPHGTGAWFSETRHCDMQYGALTGGGYGPVGPLGCCERPANNNTTLVGGPMPLPMPHVHAPCPMVASLPPQCLCPYIVQPTAPVLAP